MPANTEAGTESMAVAVIALMLRRPRLLKKWFESKKKESEQKTIVELSALMFIAGFVLAGLDVWTSRRDLADV